MAASSAAQADLGERGDPGFRSRRTRSNCSRAACTSPLRSSSAPRVRPGQRHHLRVVAAEGRVQEHPGPGEVTLVHQQATQAGLGEQMHRLGPAARGRLQHAAPVAGPPGRIVPGFGAAPDARSLPCREQPWSARSPLTAQARRRASASMLTVCVAIAASSSGRAPVSPRFISMTPRLSWAWAATCGSPAPMAESAGHGPVRVTAPRVDRSVPRSSLGDRDDVGDAGGRRLLQQLDRDVRLRRRSRTARRGAAWPGLPPPDREAACGPPRRPAARCRSRPGSGRPGSPPAARRRRADAWPRPRQRRPPAPARTAPARRRRPVRSRRPGTSPRPRPVHGDEQGDRPGQRFAGPVQAVANRSSSGSRCGATSDR